MKKTKCSAQTLALAGALLLSGALSAKAAITLDLQESTLGQRASYGITASSTVGAGINANEWIGLYRFSATGGPANPFWTMCFSPAGVLDNASHTYTLYNFTAGGGNGNNPAAWSQVGVSDSGIQNAQYLWRLNSPSIISSGTAAQGTGLALAIYEALYDSTGYGKTDTGGNGKFWLTSPLSGDIYNAYTGYLSALNGPSSVANVTANQAGGNILRSIESGAGQDMIWNVTPVPEPTTMIAGALLLLPFGASTLRFFRKNRTA